MTQPSRTFVSFLVALALVTAHLFAALPQSDTFTRGDATGVGALGANWTEIQGTFAIGSFQVTGAGTTYNFIKWSADSFNADQFSQVTVSGTNVGPAVRMSGTSGADASAYLLFCSVGGSFSLRKWVAGAETTITSFGTVATGDVVKLKVVGLDLTTYQNTSPINTTTDSGSTLSSGSAGMVAYANGVGILDDWSGDNVGGGGGGGTPAGFKSLLGVGRVLKWSSPFFWPDSSSSNWPLSAWPSPRSVVTDTNWPTSEPRTSRPSRNATKCIGKCSPTAIRTGR